MLHECARDQRGSSSAWRYGVQSNRGHVRVVQTRLEGDRWAAAWRGQWADRARRGWHAPPLGRDARLADGLGRVGIGVDRTLRRGAALWAAVGRTRDEDSTAAVEVAVALFK